MLSKGWLIGLAAMVSLLMLVSTPVLADIISTVEAMYGGAGSVQEVSADKDQLWYTLNGDARVKFKSGSRYQYFGFIPGQSGGTPNLLLSYKNGTLEYPTGVNVVDGWAYITPYSGWFRFYDDPGDSSGPAASPPLYSSVPSENSDGLDHMRTFEIVGTGNYVLAWEDRLGLGKSPDYDELIVEVSGVGDAPPPAVPEPGTLLLLGTGLAGLACHRFRRRKK
jgi:hypothetical protein